MKKYTFKRQFLLVVFMLLGCLAIHAADDDLITKQITVKLDKAGTLHDKIGSAKKYKITNLKIVGEINGDDVYFMRKMAGYETDGKLAILDLLDAKIEAIGSYAFSGCSSLTSVAIPSGVTYIGLSAFSGCSSLTSVAIPSGVTYIGFSAFSGCSSLTSVAIPSGVTSIGESTFCNCSSLTSIEIPSSVTSIGEYAFYNCSSLTSIEIPSGVTYIGFSAFSGCSSLTSIEIPSSVMSIGESAFQDNSGLKSVYVSRESPIGIDVNVFENIDKTTCILYVPQGTKDDYWLSSWGDAFDNIVEYDVTGIDQVANGGEAKEVSRYSVDGKRQDAPAKGLNIVRYSDGSVRKIVVQ